MPDEKPLMRSLGEFFGEIWKGVRTDPSRPGRISKRRVEERVEQTSEGPVILRRTIIEEVIVPPRPAPEKEP